MMSFGKPFSKLYNVFDHILHGGRSYTCVLTALHINMLAVTYATSKSVYYLIKLIATSYVGHQISSDTGLISQILSLKSEFYYPLHVPMGIAYSCLYHNLINL